MDDGRGEYNVVDGTDNKDEQPDFYFELQLVIFLGIDLPKNLDRSMEISPKI